MRFIHARLEETKVEHVSSSISWPNTGWILDLASHGSKDPGTSVGIRSRSSWASTTLNSEPGNFRYNFGHEDPQLRVIRDGDSSDARHPSQRQTLWHTLR